MFDKVAAAALLVVSAQLLVLIAIAIRIESRGPVLFRQERFGLDGATIKLTKFRTMYHHMADANGRQQATHCDSRVTRVGRFLRRTTLDELPQFWDVLVGRMSLVGPRPHPMGMTINDELASDVILRYKDRLRTRPGITGLAQIRGNRGPVPDVQTGQRRINLDNEYIETWTFMTDIKILLKTVVVPFQKGCY
ncbi:MAG: sugar transferase [Defluviimonas sp.]|nr:sugar transferase [Defluviimonas sp.]